MEKFDQLIGEIQPFEGAHELLAEVKERRFRLVLASSGKTQHVEAFLDLIDAKSLADAWTTPDDVKHSKPEPDIVATALAKVDGASAVLVGDSLPSRVSSTIWVPPRRSRPRRGGMVRVANRDRPRTVSASKARTSGARDNRGSGRRPRGSAAAGRDAQVPAGPGGARPRSAARSVRGPAAVGGRGSCPGSSCGPASSTISGAHASSGPAAAAARPGRSDVTVAGADGACAHAREVAAARAPAADAARAAGALLDSAPTDW